MNPTAQAYGDLNTAYAHFNAALFGGELPGCLITLQRKNGCFGYFCGDRFAHKEGGEVTDEIALNPSHFAERSTERTLSTLAHEMVHLWQHHFGKPSRSAYHNKEWAAKMREVGLIPTDTGQPGGKETGQRVTHLIEDGGPFARACAELVGDGYGVAWVENSYGGGSLAGGEGGEDDGEEGDDPDAAKAAAKKKVKYTCPACGINAWGKPGLRLICGEDNQPLEAVE